MDKGVNKYLDNKDLMNKIYSSIPMNFISKQRLNIRNYGLNVKKVSYGRKGTKIEKSYLNLFDKIEDRKTGIVKNNELFQFVMSPLYWILLYNFLTEETRRLYYITKNNSTAPVNDQKRTVYCVSKSFTLDKLIEYYGKIMRVTLDLTYEVPKYEFENESIARPDLYENKTIINAPSEITKKEYDFLFLEFYKKEKGKDRNPYHIFITMLHTLNELVPCIQEGSNCLIMTEYIEGNFPLVILNEFFKCYEKVEFVEIYKQEHLLPHYYKQFPIKLTGFKKSKEKAFMKKCKELMKVYPFKYSGKSSKKPKVVKKLEKDIEAYNKRVTTKYLEVLDETAQRLELNLYSDDDNIRDAFLLCQRYKIPTKDWIPQEKFLEDNYGVYLMSRLFSFDQNIVFSVRENKNNNNSNSNKLDRIYDDLLHKFHLVGLPIEYIESDKWWKLNRMYRWYEKTLAQHLQDKYNVNVMGRFVSRAWLKMFEILRIFNLKSKDEVINTFHICEAPGNMIMAINYYIETVLKKKHNWVAQSLVESEIGDDYGLIKKHKNRWDMGKKKTGDITDLDNILYYRDTYSPKKIEWISCDCGHEFAKAEETAQLHFAELLTMQLILKEGGSFISKLYFPIKDEVMIKLLSAVSKQFKEVYFYKSYQNPWNTEVYIIGKGYKPDKKIHADLINVYKNGLKGMKNATKKFRLQLLNFSEQLYQIFSQSINRNLYYYDHIDEIDEELLKGLVQSRNKDWDKMFMKGIKGKKVVKRAPELEF